MQEYCQTEVCSEFHRIHQALPRFSGDFLGFISRLIESILIRSGSSSTQRRFFVLSKPYVTCELCTLIISGSADRVQSVHQHKEAHPM